MGSLQLYVLQKHITNKQTNKQTDRQTNKQTDKQTNRQTNKQNFTSDKLELPEKMKTQFVSPTKIS